MAADKLERLLDLIATLLHTARPLTAAELHERIEGYQHITDKETFKRSFERDKADLREMDVPIEVADVPGRLPPVEGYRIDPAKYYLDDPALEPDELAALHLAASAVRLDESGVATGLRKLGEAVDAEAPASVALLPHVANLSDAFDAVGNHRRVTFTHRGKVRDVDPFRLQLQRGHWYLQGYDHDAGEARSFRLDRVEGSIAAGDPDSATHDLDPAANPLQLDGWAIGDDEPVEAHVRVARAQAVLAVRMVPAADATWNDDGSVELRFMVRSPDGFRNFVLGFLDDAEVLGPPSLREHLRTWFEATAAGLALEGAD